jgi:hypothetical protein
MADANDYIKHLSQHDIMVREKFIGQYIIDFDPVQACLRMGYGDAAAKQVSSSYMQDAYVLNRIEYEKDRLGVSTDAEMHRRRLVAGLYRIASDRKVSATAQVSAYGQIAKILGLEAPTKIDNTVHGVGPSEITFRVVDAQPA